MDMGKRQKSIQRDISIKHIKVQNFKSFKSLDIALDRFNIIIGANASGKSNFAQIFKFLNDIALYGLENAVSHQGGMEYLLNFTRPSSSLSYEIIFDSQTSDKPFFISRMIKHKTAVTKAVYRFEIQPTPDSNIGIVNDEWKITVSVLSDEKEKIPLEVIISNKDGKLKMDIGHTQSNQLENEIEKIKNYEDFFTDITLAPSSLSLEAPIVANYMLEEIGNFCYDIEVYDFDPKLAKLPVQLRGSSDLDPDGANLAIAMKNVMRDPDNQEMFSRLIADVLPFVRSFDTEKLLDSSVMLTQDENYFANKPMPAILISDGTINVTALICALYFQHNPLAIIEEPERNIHPALIAKIIDMIKDASIKKQVIATTHSAEMVQHANIKNILLIERDETGNSRVTKPGNRRDVNEFLKNDMDIRELYIQNMLGD